VRKSGGVRLVSGREHLSVRRSGFEVTNAVKFAVPR
jgi:hypothetical protein